MEPIVEPDYFEAQLINIDQPLPSFEGSLLIFFGGSEDGKQWVEPIQKASKMGKLVVVCLPAYLISAREMLICLPSLSHMLVLADNKDPAEAKRLTREAAMALYRMATPSEGVVGPEDPHLIQYFLIDGKQSFFTSVSAQGENAGSTILHQVYSFMGDKIRKAKTLIICLLVGGDITLSNINELLSGFETQDRCIILDISLDLDSPSEIRLSLYCLGFEFSTENEAECNQPTTADNTEFAASLRFA